MWPHDDTASKNAFYGDFHSKGWVEKNLIHMTTPFRMFYDKQPMLHGILVHRKIQSPLALAFLDIYNACDKDQGKVDKTGASDWGGCFNIRPIAGTNSWSNHSWACAVDLAPSTNGFNMQSTLSSLVVDAMKKQGALWGGDYRGRKDPMHFEFVSR